MRSRPARNFLLFLGLLAALALCGAAYWSLRLACADRLFHARSIESRRRAAELVPGNVRYQANSDLAVVRLSPYGSAARIRLGFQAELAGDQKGAEDWFLKAAEVDRTYEPRWALANFYFRRGRAEEFWLWARRSAEMAYQNQSALFDLSWRMSQDPDTILRRAIPDRPRILAQYLDYLLRLRKLEPASRAVSRLIPLAGAEDQKLLLAYCDRLLEAGQSTAAVASWNLLAARALIPHEPLEPSAGRSLTNGDFAIEPTSSGFDWRVAAVGGVAVSRPRPPGGIRFSFSGNQPENALLLSQLLPLAPSTKYRFRFERSASGISSGSGLQWVLQEGPTGGELGRLPETASEFPFTTPAGCRLANLSLVYRRAPGTTRIEGSLVLHRVTLELAP
jgi:hypothetical protein